MKNFFSWFIKPVVLSLLGVILLSLLMWFGGPQLGFGESRPLESETVRWVFIWIFFGLWAGYFLWKFIRAKMANAQLMRSIAGEGQKAPAPGAHESAAEIAALGKLMQEAMATLKKSKQGGLKGGQYMYQLPWYMFVGAPGTGKTTALSESGLNFPLKDLVGKKAIGGIGGTRNCDWWFTDEAVLLDTAGRYTTQDSYTEVDKAAWTGFLDLLKKHRRSRPINGVIIAVSASELMQMSETARQTQALAIRERIKELHERLEIRFPIYVMVTKCDLMAGFIEYFDNLGREERTQVWGMTFPMIEADKVDDVLAAFPAEFKSLESQLQVRVLARVQQERDIQRRALIYGFPQQFAAIGDPLGRFLNEVFQSTRYEERALLRGVYFTSGTQEGSPIDRVMGALAASFGLDRHVLPPNAASGRSYFITRLLNEVVFKEAELVGTNLRFEKRKRLIHWGAAAGLGVLLLLGCAGLITSYLRNQTYVADVAHSVEELDKLAKGLPAQGSPLAVLPLLAAAREIPGGYGDKDTSTPWLSRLGLSQRGKLGDGAKTLYLRLLRDTLQPRIVGGIEEQLRRGNSNNPEYLYEILRVYLMMGDASHFDAESIGAWVDFDWRRTLTGANEEQRTALSIHVAALLEAQTNDTPVQLDKGLIAQTRLALAQLPLQQRIYNRLKRELARAKLPEFSATSAGGINAPQVFVRRSGEPLTRGVPGIYSVAGYRKYLELSEQAVADIAKDSWVLAQQEAVASAGSSEQIKQAVQQLYYDDYIKQWDQILADVTIIQFSSLDQGARTITMLTGAESPLKKFLQGAAKETTLESVKSGKIMGDSMSKALKSKFDAAKNRLGALAEAGVDDAMRDGAGAKPTNPVDAHFDALHKLVGQPAGGAAAAGGASGAAGGAGGAGGGAPAPIDSTLAMLKDLGVYLDAANSAKASGTPAPAGDVLTRLKREGQDKPAPLQAMIQTVDNSTAGLTLGSERARINSLWTARAAQFCRQAIAGRYPLVRKEGKEVTADDFGQFFSPGGIMDDFFQKNLQAYVDTGGSNWTWRPVGNVSLGIPQGVLTEFQRAARIRDAFFSQGGKQASMRFDIKTVTVDPALTKLLLDIDGQQLIYAPNSGVRSANFQLPSGKGSGQVRFETSPLGPGGDLHTDGPWAWFRMIDKGVIEPTAQGERFKLNFDLSGRKVVLEMGASSVINPFKRDALEQFHCLDRF